MLHYDIIFSVNHVNEIQLDTTIHTNDLNDISNKMQYDLNEQPARITKTNNYSRNEDNVEELLTPGIMKIQNI